MASVSRDKNGLVRILFTAPDGKRPSIRLGKVSQRAAESLKIRVEQLLESLLLKRAMEPDLAKWVAGLEPTIAKKLARVGLILEPEAKLIATLKPFIDGYIERRVDVSPHTRRIWRQTLRLLVERFGEDKPLGEITRGNATDWRLALVAKKMADASVRKHCGFAKHFFKQAVEHELIAANPFEKLVSAPVGNEKRQYFVSREETASIIEAAPDAEWRLIIALSRYGGLRCPSEHLALEWDDIDWANNRMTVKSPKTARHAGHESRIVPIFPELRPYLEVVFDAAEPGTESVITRYRHDSNLRTQLKRIIKRAGLTPWPRITHNLRSSRQTELEESFPSHVVCRWIGNSQQVARKHYLQLTDEHFERAIESGAKTGALAAQNEAQQAHAAIRTNSQNKHHDRRQTLAANDVTPSRAKLCDKTQNVLAEVHGNRTHRRRASRAARRF